MPLLLSSSLALQANYRLGGLGEVTACRTIKASTGQAVVLFFFFFFSYDRLLPRCLATHTPCRPWSKSASSAMAGTNFSWYLRVRLQVKWLKTLVESDRLTYMVKALQNGKYFRLFSLPQVCLCVCFGNCLRAECSLFTFRLSATSTLESVCVFAFFYFRDTLPFAYKNIVNYYLRYDTSIFCVFLSSFLSLQVYLSVATKADACADSEQNAAGLRT